MKKCLGIFFWSVVMSFAVRAQDIVVKTNGDQIKVKVAEITTEVIRYRNFDQPNGPIRVIGIKEVFKITYENGTEEVFNDVKKSAPAVSKKQEPVQRFAGDVYDKPAYEHANYFSLAAGYGNSYGGLGVRAQVRFGGVVGLGFHAGVGYFPSFSLSESGDADMKGGVLFSGGVKFFIFKPLYIDGQFGTFAYASRRYTYYDYYSGYSYYFSEEKSGYLYGPSGMIGGDFIFGGHFGFNAAAGVSYNLNKDFAEYKLWPALDLGFVIRF
jgi:hypothetical protein